MDTLLDIINSFKKTVKLKKLNSKSLWDALSDYLVNKHGFSVGDETLYKSFNGYFESSYLKVFLDDDGIYGECNRSDEYGPLPSSGNVLLFKFSNVKLLEVS
jgi:hypothetical protein